jgi:predicted dehydrogenase
MAKLGIGIVGCGNIAMTYLRNAPLFAGLEPRACADVLPAQAALRASEYGLRACTVEALMADQDIDLVLNLTVPAAHHDVTLAALAAGKHVFTEKPLALSTEAAQRLVTEAKMRGLALGSAPDTFLGAAGRLARQLIDGGAIGRVVTGTAFMMGRGMEHWHPNPAFYYQAGAGPVLDMGPYYLTMLVNLLGPATRVMAMATSGSEERLITAPGPLHGTRFKVETPTSVLSLIHFACGATITFGASWDAYRHGNAPIELHGTEGSLRLPDPDTFGGTVSLSRRGETWEEINTADRVYGRINWPHAKPDRANYRMLGVADLAAAVAAGRPPRASGTLALHVVDILSAILRSGDSGVPVTLGTSTDQPKVLQEEEAQAFLA